MDESEFTRTPLGEADKTTMDGVIRTTIGKMFENDNDVAYLEVFLTGTDAAVNPKLLLKLQLISINDVKTKHAKEAGE